ncbi:MAG: phosphate signaling complex protein PhoU [Bacteroidales bacterium]|nr:phosphate signaling complex protein PhoU [Bacteroidales bacterium]
MAPKVEVELDKLKKETLDMWTLVYNQLQRAGEAVLTLDKDLARQVILRERRVNAFELKIDSDVEDIIALYNPVAVQLRFVLAVLKTNTNLERIGDFAEGIARFVLDFKEPAVDPELLKRLHLAEMIDNVLAMLQTLHEALQKENSTLASRLFDMDGSVDEINRAAPDILVAYILENPAVNAKDALRLSGIFRKLERVGDHCTNIAEEIIFYLDAKVLKHQGKNNPDQP